MSSQQPAFDLVIRGGLIVNGDGGEPFVGDVGIRGDKIVAIGAVTGSGAEEIDAHGKIVTPGFVDVHTHYDGQSIWADRMTPSSCHGVTTAVMGNCGVGFAPCRAGDRDLMIKAMEGVEDIPGVVMNAGLTWNWETFPQFLDAVDSRPHDIDVAAYLPHSPLRVFVMGERGANREPATPEDIAKMRAAVKEAMAAGAMGVATSRIHFHRRSDGEFIPSFGAAAEELVNLASEASQGGGIFQVVPELTESNDSATARPRFELLRDISQRAGVHVSFSAAQAPAAPHLLSEILQWVSRANADEGASISMQIYPRPIGLVLGLDLTSHPFVKHPAYRALADLPLEERVAALRQLETRARILADSAGAADQPLTALSRNFEQMYALGRTPNYEPDPADSVAGIARRRGVTPDEVAYDMLLEDDGHGKLMVAIGNYADGSLDFLVDTLPLDQVIVGLGDGGAHYGLVCDASYPTFMLTHWARDRANGRIPLPALIRMLTSKPAEMIGFGDRGRLALGMKADINVIDHEGLRLEAPSVVYDLPGGGRRLMQGAHGFAATIVSGKVTIRDDQPTGELPGRLVRGRQSAPQYAAAAE
jgi:N-acyl-D-aspartate/D-glutamate deacylase